LNGFAFGARLGADETWVVGRRYNNSLDRSAFSRLFIRKTRMPGSLFPRPVNSTVMFLFLSSAARARAGSVFVLAMLLLASNDSFACACIGPGTAREGLKRANSVFLGRVVAVNEDKFTFDVERVWKGASSRQIVVRDWHAGTDCAFNFKLGTRYVVFAVNIQDEGKTILIGDVCNWTSTFPAARAVIRQIGNGRPLRQVKAVPLRGET